MDKERTFIQFQEQVLQDYENLCSEQQDTAPDTVWEWQQYTLADLIELLNLALKKIPAAVDYDMLYCFCALNRVFPDFLMLIQSAGTLDTASVAHVFIYAKIFLNAGAYTECIQCCDACLQKEHIQRLSPKDYIEILFTKSKALRNTGRYQDALYGLWEALQFVDKHGEIAYMQGSVLLRIGKVYSEYLMMIGVSICFLQEAKDQLEKWIGKADDPFIQRYVKKEYAICLDAMGQYWREKRDSEKAVELFTEAEKWNRSLGRLSGVYRNEAHIMAVHLKEGVDDAYLNDMIFKMRSIIRQLMDDRGNQKGLGVRQLHLARMQAAAGDLQSAAASLKESRRMSRLYRDNKTLIKAKILELQYGIYQDVVDMTSLTQILDLAREQKCYNLEITLNQWIIRTIESRRMGSSDVLSPLQRNRTLYLNLSAMAQATILKVTQHENQNEFFYLSEKNSANLLTNVVSDYEWFVQSMNDIIELLLKITKSRSDELATAVISEAKASLASSVLHDLKHILTKRNGDNVVTYLDPVIDALERWEGRIPREEYERLIPQISMVNTTLKESIYPRILEATRMPQDFHQTIFIYHVLSDLSRQKPEEYQRIGQPITVSCPEDLTVEYNYNIFATLMKELLRNAIDYQKKTGAAVSGYCLMACENLGQITFSVQSEFKNERDAERAFHQIDQQLQSKATEDGYGIKLLRNFMRVKTGNAIGPRAEHSKEMAGICFVVPQKTE